MRHLKLFENWLIENQVPSSLTTFFRHTWNEIRFPWEDEIVENLEEIKQILNSLDEDFETNRYGESSDPTYHLNIKFHDGPNVENLCKKYNISEDSVFESWSDYLSDQLESFVDSLDYGWLQDTWQSGRSGGWLTLEVYPQYDTENALDRVLDHLANYESEVEDYDPISSEELHRMRGSLFAGSYGLGMSDKAKNIKFLKEEKDLLVKNMQEEIEMMKALKEGLEEVQKLISEGMKGLVAGFEDFMKKEMEQ
jgi:hypothetical protein